MRMPGIGEIILILIVATVVRIGVRMFGTPPPKKKRRAVRYVEEDEDDDYEDDDTKVIKARRSRRTQILGVVIIIIGAVVMLSTLSMVKWIFWGPIGAIVLVVIGILTIFLARRRRES